MVSVRRWKAAQSYEIGFWEAQARRIAAGSEGQLGWYRWRAEQLILRLERLGLHRLTGGDARVVEVGSGPIGVATFFPGAERVAVDPLADEYARNPVLSELRDPAVEYRAGLGERLPCPDAAYDLAIIENCIDHVQDMGAVMRELVRVLRPDGVLYLTVNNRTRWGFVVHRVLSRLRIDRGHPHTFTPARTSALMRRSGFRIVDFEVGSYEAAKREDQRSPERKARLKALLGISEYLVSVVAALDG
jgi:SAM-dependent methyltransferase